MSANLSGQIHAIRDSINYDRISFKILSILFSKSMLIFSLIIFILNFARVLYLFSKANTYLHIIFKFFWLFSKKHLFLSSKNTISKYKCKPFSICHSPLIALLSNCILFPFVFVIKYLISLVSFPSILNI